MFRTLSLVASLVALLVAAPAAAQVVTTGTGTVAINNQTLAAPRTSTAVGVFGWGTAKLQVRFTFNTATRLTFLLEESDDATTWSRLTKTNADDVTTVFNPYWDTGSATGNVTLLVDVVGLTYLRITVTPTGGSATDYVTLVVRPARGE